MAKRRRRLGSPDASHLGQLKEHLGYAEEGVGRLVAGLGKGFSCAKSWPLMVEAAEHFSEAMTHAGSMESARGAGAAVQKRLEMLNVRYRRLVGDFGRACVREKR